MDASILSRIRQSFLGVPEEDGRASIGPRLFLIKLIMAMVNDSNRRSLANLRRQLLASVDGGLARSSFWQRLSSRRLTKFLTQTIRQLVAGLAGKLSVNADILGKLGVRSVYLHDSSSITLPKKARGHFPAPRNNVIPAATKWHLCLNLFSGIGEWFCLTEATCHDRNGFPPLEMLKGALIIFDLGYWDYQLLADLMNSGCYFLSRVKDRALIEITAIPSCQAWKKPLGKNLFAMNWSKFRGPIIDIIGTVRLKDMADADMRVIGFWNEAARTYHWYATNLTVRAELIYPLYRLRWQVELIFKAGKSSLNLADVPSSNYNIIVNIVLAAITANLIAQPLARMTLQNAVKEIQASISIQRAGYVFVHVASELMAYLITGLKADILAVEEKLLRYATELIDPNFKHRPTSMRRIAIMQ